MNTMVDRLRRSWELFKCSVLVLREHPKLLLFPIINGFLTLVIAVFFLLPVLASVVAPHWGDSNPWIAFLQRWSFIKDFGTPASPSAAGTFPLGSVATIYLAGIYLVSMVLATFYNVAFNSEILEALNGQPVSLGHGIEVAFRRFPSILLWSLLAGLVGLIIRTLEERLSFVGRLIAGLIGLAWSVSCVFVIPILVRETSTVNPIKVLAQSAATIKQTWGEMLAGYVGLRGADVLFFWASLLFWAMAGLLGFVLSNFWVLLPAGGLWLLCLFAYLYVASVASKVYLCALFIYASEGIVPSHYDEDMMAMAWKTK